ncbi:MAG: YgaP-like transmembrane domain [Candidatus Moraniibacteriota bacterium]
MSKKIYRQNIDHWYLERVVFLVAGLLVVFSVLMSLAGYFNFQYFALLVGAMLVNFSLTGYCPLVIIAAKLGMRGK